jgi:hypothetical protein
VISEDFILVLLLIKANVASSSVAVLKWLPMSRPFTNADGDSIKILKLKRKNSTGVFENKSTCRYDENVFELHYLFCPLLLALPTPFFSPSDVNRYLQPVNNQ